VIEEVGTQESMTQAIRATRPGGHIGYVGVSHDVTLDCTELFFSEVHPHGGPAPVRRFLPGLIDLIWNRHIDPWAVFDLTSRLRTRPKATGHGRAPRGRWRCPRSSTLAYRLSFPDIASPGVASAARPCSGVVDGLGERAGVQQFRAGTAAQSRVEGIDRLKFRGWRVAPWSRTGR
jgi:hypothetical protein